MLFTGRESEIKKERCILDVGTGWLGSKSETALPGCTRFVPEYLVPGNAF